MAPRISALALVVVCATTAGPLISSASAQGEQKIPSRMYQITFGPFYEGEYKDALDRFALEGRGAIKTGQMRWIDSICYETMAGECYYHMGRLNQALDHYTAALKLYVAYFDWMVRVQFPPGIRPSNSRMQIPWGVSTRRSKLGYFPESMLMAQGRINNNEIIRRGGVVQQAYLRPVNVQEIVRCTTLAIRRRTEILGPVCRHDPLTAQLINVLSRRPGPPNHWSEAWVDVQLGLALVAGGRDLQAVPHLTRAIVAAGEFDHPLTATALFELGRLALIRSDYPVAAKFFQEATFAAAFYYDYGVLEEAFRYGALTHLMSNQKGIYPLLPGALQWAKVHRELRQLYASLLLLAAENYAVLAQTPQAAEMLEGARLAVGRRNMGAGRIGARLNYLTSLVLFQQAKVLEGDTALAAAMNYMQQGSFWLYHISLVDNLYTTGGISPRVAMDLYGAVLRDPQPADWAFDPMESMASLLAPHPLPLEHWFYVAVHERKEHEKALEIADRARRHRFFSTLGFGGRLQSLRWILEGPSESLDQKSQLLRRDLLTRYPGYDQLAQRAGALRAELEKMPLVVEDPDGVKQQRNLLEQLAAVSLAQEAVLRELAVRREPAGLVFPPLRTAKEIQKSLPKGTALLVFFATSRHLYAFLLNNEKYTYWQVGSPAALSRKLVALLRNMGHFQQNHELALEELTDTKWKESARELLDLLLKGSHADFAQSFDELVIVPDGLLWYVPFEALQVPVNGKLQPLISRFRIRCVPTASLAVGDRRGRNATGNTAVVLGRLFPRDDDAVAQAAFEQIADVLPGSVALAPTPPAPSAFYGALFDRLIVLDDMNVSLPGPYDWAPLPADQGKPGGSLNDWLGLPWQGPDEIILPGFHTAAEASLKGVNGSTAGNEVFLSVCGLMASGARTLLISRWRTGGKSSFDLVREFAQELPHTTPADAWQRSIFLAADSRLDLPREPRIKRTVTDESPRANHPFFWAGYLLIDSGDAPRKDQPQPKAAPGQ